MNLLGVNIVAPYFLLGALAALLYGLIIFVGGLRARSARIRFGQEKRIDALVTHDASKRRAWKGVCIVAATVLAFIAAARPQYGKAQRLIPATNIDVVIVLDYSKSMYAQDVEPSRIFRAKLEVESLVTKLRGARFAAVAFAGEPIGYPLTSDGSAIATFLRQLEPNDMPVGGTAIARALEHARDILRRDPKSKDHKKVIVLITDGEDLEGSPVGVAKSLKEDGTTVHVVQIGGRSAEPIPIVENGKPTGRYMETPDGRPLTTELTSRAEGQLKAVATATEGEYVSAEKGSTGIEVIAEKLQKQMKTELSERVEEVYADVFMYPLMLAILLLIIEAFITDAPRRVFLRKAAPLAAMPPSLRLALSKAGAIGAPVPIGPPPPAKPTGSEPQSNGAPKPPPANPGSPSNPPPAYVKEGGPGA